MIPPAFSLQSRNSFGGIAQSVEHRPFKPLVLGSNPSAPTISKKQQTMGFSAAMIGRFMLGLGQ